MRTLLLVACLLTLGGTAGAQLRSGPDAPAVSSQLPPSLPPGNSQPGPEGEVRAPGVAPDPRAGAGIPRPPGPPSGHEVLGGPPVPGARRPDHSEGFFTNRDVIPPRVGGAPMQSGTPPAGR
ncbi:hypothetical protein DFH01_19755 [Falsiroseomonas bella]|uniref:Translation initiation factor IF-2 n=1 Tax=Falsiroseomonas bella TaxID=2184016 RepID=A0A317FBG5_9PROT|nr:hypothetical protein DFH01_19755 [Falsiroseomonas bella]